MLLSKAGLKLYLLALLCLVTCSLEGCGAQKTTVRFVNETNIDRAFVDTKYDPISASRSPLNGLEIVDAQGHIVQLNPSKKPILVVAYWCPHCQRTLVTLYSTFNTLKEKPDVLYVSFPSGTTFAQAVNVQKQEFSDLHIGKFDCYFVISGGLSQLTPNGNIPALIYSNAGHIYTLTGEHSLNVWKKALSE